jgi:hypothetical protein
VSAEEERRAARTEALRASGPGALAALWLRNGERVIFRRTRGHGRHEWCPLPGQGVSSEALADGRADAAPDE